MTTQWIKNIPLITLLLFLSGCSIFHRSQHPETEIFDSLVERNRQWREQIDEGNWALQNQELDRALDAYRAAMAIKPESSEVQLKIAEIYFQRQEYENARDAFAMLLKLDPKNISARNYLGYIYENLNDYEAAVHEYEQTLQIHPRDLYTLNHLGLAYKQLHRLDEAEQVLRKALEVDPKSERPESKNLHNYLGLIYLERGEVGEAIAEFRESMRLFPKDIWVRQNLAALYEEHGRYYEAQLQYNEILQVDPQNLLAPTRLQALAQLSLPTTTPADTPPVNLIDIDVDAIIAQVPAATDYPDADAVILLNQFSHDVLPSGQSRYTSHQLVKLLTERGVQKYDDIAIPYNLTAQHIAVNVARTIRPDGSVVEPLHEAFNDVTPPGLLSYNLYSDAMWRVISMPALEPGVCIEYQVTLEDIGTESVGSTTWFWGGFSFQSTDPTRQSNYALRVPKTTHFRWKAINCQLNPQVLHEEETSTYLWAYGETPKFKAEVNMPPTNDIVPRLTYSSVDSWDAIYHWYKELAKDRYTVDEGIEETVRRLTADFVTKEDKIREIYHFVASQIRYVGIELGQGAYQPSPANQVLKVRYGDCKDKTTLMIAMLDLVGIEAFPVLINPAPYERVDVEIPSLGHFSHAITAIPRDDGSYIWLDATSETCSYGDLPVNDQGRKGFVIRHDRGEFVDIPTFPPESNRLIVDTVITLNMEGAIKGKMRIDTRGQYNLDSRLRYKQVPPDALKDTFAAELNRQLPGVRIEQVQISDLNDLNTPVQIDIVFSVEEYAKQIGGRMLFPLPNDEFADYAEIFAAEVRKSPLDLSYPMQMDKTVQIALPEGWTAALPDDIHLDHSFASMDRWYSQDERTLRYKLDFTLKDLIVSPEDYPTAKHFFEALAREDGAQLILEKHSKPKA